MGLNLFTIFDPRVSLVDYPLGWITTRLSLLILLRSFWPRGERWRVALLRIIETLKEEIGLLFKPSIMAGVIIPIALFTLLLGNNIPGLLPFVFTSTRHLVISLSLSLPVWLGVIIFRILNYPIRVLSHLVPQGTPAPLIRFIVLIERISNIIRPITLAVRLRANMIAGHLLLALLGGSVVVLQRRRVVSVGLCLSVLGVLEVAVAAIQAYVFSTLVTLYITEV